MTTYKNLLTELDEKGILTITINREEKLNALNIETIGEIKSIAEDVSTNPDIKAAILTGKGTKAFVAGADISEFADFSAEEAKKMSYDGHLAFNALEQLNKPIIAAINGFALGGGAELALACHFRIASINARIGLPEVGLGVIPGYGGTQRLTNLVGKGRAMELIMTTDMLQAEDALRLNIVNHVVGQEELIKKAKEILGKILTKGPLAITHTINCVNAAVDPSKDGYQLEIDAFGNCFASEDFKEGTLAFLEKRKPNFKGR